jgi:4-diphosphocytidyl-2-C-methyl-D-erythritol kinase
MVVTPIDLCDNLEIEIFDRSGTLQISTNKHDIPTNQENILFKIYNAFYEKSSLERRNVTVFLEKKIPHEAGLGGGSADGAAFLKTLNLYHKNFFSQKELLEIGLKIGADVPFFIQNHPARVNGIGEILIPIENNLTCKIIIVKPAFGVSTKNAYKFLSKIVDKKNADIVSIIEGLRENNLEKVIYSVENHLEQGLVIENDQIITLKKMLKHNFNTYRFFMSGSGSAYFTFVSENTTEEHLKQLRNKLINCEVFLCDFL